jgi:hypothetical protein
VRIHCHDDATPLYPQKLSLTLPTSGGCSVGIVRLRTESHGVFIIVIKLVHVRNNHEMKMEDEEDV